MTPFTYITTCKGRLAHLQQTLPCAVAQSLPCVVVDYSCPERSGDWVASAFPQVKVVRVEGESGFQVARARNAGAAAAATQWLGFFDADILLAPRFAATVGPQLRQGHFYRAMPVTRQVWGQIVCARADFEAVGGYDETYTGWGAEDDDLIQALFHRGRRLAGFDARLLTEITHSNEERTKFHSLQDISLQHRINYTFMNVKFDMMRLLNRMITPEERKTVYDKIKQTLIAAQRNGSNAPVVIEVPIPGIAFDGPPGEEGPRTREVSLLQRSLVYRLDVKRPT
jgi:hypothetical protein